MSRRSPYRSRTWQRIVALLRRENVVVRVANHALKGQDARLVGHKDCADCYQLMFVRPGLSERESVEAVLSEWARVSWFGVLALGNYHRTQRKGALRELADIAS